MPVGSHRARVAPMPPGRVGSLIASATSELTMDRAMDQITSILKQRHHLQPEAEPDFVVRSPLELRRNLEKIFDVLTILLSFVAGVALLVGGVGVMNIMLVSVTERTREIGIRMAVGATPGQVLAQFLTEALTLSLLGGLVGVAAGVITAQQLSSSFGWPLLLRTDVIFAATGFSGLVGVGFGLYPALKASRMDPITALRFE